MDRNSKLRILVLGYVVRRPLGGGTWPSLQYALGLKRLGHEVCFLEDSDDYPSCYDPTRHITDVDPTYGLAYATRVFAHYGIDWAYYDKHGDRWHGPLAGRVIDTCHRADVLINNSGIHPIRPWLEAVPRRVYIDTDPGFEQVRLLTDPDRLAHVRAHNVFLTLAENLPRGTAEIPDAGVPWQATRQPVVLSEWPVTPGNPHGRFTTVMLWHSYESREYRGQRFGMKSDSFAEFFELPQHTSAQLELAIGGADAPRDQLFENGWCLVNPLIPTRDPWTYQSYIRESQGELSIAKHGYVRSNSGWFSERSAHYLASGRPVLTQDTGFGEWLDCEGGLLRFRDMDDACDGIERIGRDYETHCRLAREVAEQYFDSARVLTRLLDIACSREA